MPTLTIRNVTEDIRDHLRLQAARHGRSVESEVREILGQDLRRKTCKPAAIAKRIHQRFAAIGGGDDLPVRENTPLVEPLKFKK